MTRTPREKLASIFRKMADNPRQQIKQLAIGTAISLVAMILLVLTSSLENAWLFYGLAFVAISAILYAIPGYIGVWVWRMKQVFFRDKQ